MSKIETLNRLAREQSQPALQIVESVQTLQRSIEQLQSMPQQIQELPDAIAQIMGPMQQALDAMSERLDVTLTIQRSSIDEMTEEMTRRAAAAMGEQATLMGRDLQTIRDHARVLIKSMDTAADAAKTLHAQTSAIKVAHESMMQSAAALRAAAKTTRSSGWLSRALGLITVALMSASAVVIGGTVLEQRLDGTARAAATWQHVTTVATEREIELLRQIVSRPAR